MCGKEIIIMANSFDNGDVSFNIIEEIGVLSTYSTGWAKEINLVSWNGGPARYDIRDWDPKHQRMSRGVTLQENEMRALVESLRRRRRNSRGKSAEKEEAAEAFLSGGDDAFESVELDELNSAGVEDEEGVTTEPADIL